MEQRRALRSRPRRAAEDRNAVRGVHRRRRPVRSGVLRNFPARSRDDRPAAETPLGGQLGGDRTGRNRSRQLVSEPHGRLFGNLQSGLRVADYRSPRRDSGVSRDRQLTQRRRRAVVVHPRSARAEHGDRHRLLVLAGGAPFGMSKPAQSGMRSGPCRRRQSDAVARDERHFLQVAHAGPRRPLQNV